MRRAHRSGRTTGSNRTAGSSGGAGDSQDRRALLGRRELLERRDSRITRAGGGSRTSRTSRRNWAAAGEQGPIGPMGPAGPAGHGSVLRGRLGARRRHYQDGERFYRRPPLCRNIPNHDSADTTRAVPRDGRVCRLRQTRLRRIASYDKSGLDASHAIVVEIRDLTGHSSIASSTSSSWSAPQSPKAPLVFRTPQRLALAVQTRWSALRVGLTAGGM